MLTKRTTETFYFKRRLHMKFQRIMAIIFCAALMLSATACHSIHSDIPDSATQKSTLSVSSSLGSETNSAASSANIGQ